MTAEHKYFNRREERRKLGSRASRRANTKSGVVRRKIVDGVLVQKKEYKTAPKALLNERADRARQAYENVQSS